MRVGEVMSSPAIAIAKEATVKELLALWKEHPVNGFPVLEGDHVVGVVSESDLVYRDRPLKPPAFLAIFDTVIALEIPKHLKEEIQKTVGARVGDIMSAPAVTIRPESDVGEAATLMLDRKVDRLPVVDAAGKLVGIVSRTDIVRTLT